MAQTLTDRVKAIKNTPGTGEQVQISEINSAFDKFDNHFIPAAKMHDTATQSIPNSSTSQALFNVVTYDSYASRPEGTMVDINTDSITIRKAGFYLVTFNGTFALNATGIRRLEIAKNATSILTKQESISSANGGQAVSVSDTFLLAVNDVITGKIFQNSGSALNFTDGGFLEGRALSVIWQGSAVEV